MKQWGAGPRLLGTLMGLMLVTTATLSLAGSPGASESGPLPNLRPIEPLQVFWGPSEDGSGRMEIRIAPIVENVGDAALEIRGELQATLTELPAAQCVDREGEVCTAWRPAGSVRQAIFPVDQCWGFVGSMAYELRSMNPDGSPNLGVDGLVAGTVATRAWHDVLPDPDHPANDDLAVPRFRSCVGFARQGLSPGWVTSWDDDIPGQQIGIDNVPDGRYALLVMVDPFDQLAESDKTDNILSRRVVISGGGADVEIT